MFDSASHVTTLVSDVVYVYYFTGMNTYCFPKCILTAPHHGLPRHQKLPINFLPFVSHSFGLCCAGVQCFRTFYFCSAVTVHIGFQWSCLVQKEPKDTGFCSGTAECTKSHGRMFACHYKKLQMLWYYIEGFG